MQEQQDIHALWVEGVSSAMLSEFIRQYPYALHPFFNSQLMMDKPDYLTAFMELLRQANIINLAHSRHAQPLNISLYTSSQRSLYKPFVQYYMRRYEIATLDQLVGKISYIAVHNNKPREVHILYDDVKMAGLMIYTEALQYCLIPKYAH